MTDFNAIKDAILSIPPKAKLDNIRPEINWYHQPYLNTYDWLTSNNPEPVDLRHTYLTFEALEDNIDISFITNSNDIIRTIEISTNNGGTWTQKTSGSYSDPESVIATLNTGEKLLVRGSNESYGHLDHTFDQGGEAYNVQGCSFMCSVGCEVYGNIMSLIDKNNFAELDEVKDYAFVRLFYYSNIKNYKNKLILPATKLGKYCYSFMFGNSTITAMPELPSTTLSEGCYAHMFEGTWIVRNVQRLPATTLTSYCYEGMFSQCRYLKVAPELPSTELTPYCYKQMFAQCERLETAPDLPAAILKEQCYFQMFSSCGKLSSIKCLATNFSAYLCTKNWTARVSSSGTFTKAENAVWPTNTFGDYAGIPDNWTVETV